jgi:hypothetical protein
MQTFRHATTQPPGGARDNCFLTTQIKEIHELPHSGIVGQSRRRFNQNHTAVKTIHLRDSRHCAAMKAGTGSLIEVYRFAERVTARGMVFILPSVVVLAVGDFVALKARYSRTKYSRTTRPYALGSPGFHNRTFAPAS